MASATACAPGRDGPCSGGAASRGGGGSRRRGRPFRPLRGAREFGRVRRAGVRRRAGGVLVVSTAGAAGPPRVGVVAGHALGGAVERNRAKRRLREALSRVRLKDGRDYVVVAGREVLEAPFPELVAWLAQAVEEQVSEKWSG